MAHQLRRDAWSESLHEALRQRELMVLVATSGRSGKPHLATADRVLPDPRGLIQVSGWLCATTIRNLRENVKLALVVKSGDDSIEIEGVVTSMEEDATLDGDVHGAPSTPQVRWNLRVHPERFLRFNDGLHSDEPLG